MIVLIVQFVPPSRPARSRPDSRVTRVPGEQLALQLKVSYITWLARLIPPRQANCVGSAANCAQPAHFIYTAADLHLLAGQC